MAVVVSSHVGWRLGHRPALDGLRGLAVALVVLCHAGWTRWYAAGQVGVTVFFVLSGFLIATLLHQELESAGRIDLRRFYARRATRLLPALYAVICASALLAVITGLPWVSTSEVVGAATYSSNLLTALGLEHLGRSSVLHHTWSLVIEEQFYLVWPALTLLLWRRRTFLLTCAAVVILASSAQRIHLTLVHADATRLAFGTSTRIDAIVIGCALAIGLRGRQLPAVSRVVGWLGLVWVSGCALMSVTPAFLVAGPTIVSVAAVGIIVSILAGSAPAWLASRPLTWLGRRSYGLYLWHHPVTVVLSYYGITAWAHAVILVPVSLLLTVLSWRYVEQPFLACRDLRGQKVASDAQTDVEPRVTVTA